jgi:hypothetical protein
MSLHPERIRASYPVHTSGAPSLAKPAENANLRAIQSLRASEPTLCAVIESLQVSNENLFLSRRLGTEQRMGYLCELKGVTDSQASKCASACGHFYLQHYEHV